MSTERDLALRLRRARALRLGRLCGVRKVRDGGMSGEAVSTEGDNKALDLDRAELDRYFRNSSPCGFCGDTVLGGRHRVMDSIRDEINGESTEEEVAAEFAVSVEAVRVALKWTDNHVLIAAVERLTAERDSARDAAVALEQQTAAVEALHCAIRIYDPCDCGHSDEAVLAGDAVDTGEFIACEETYLYSVCRECCTEDDGEQTECCVDHHDHGKGEPFCDTQRILGAFPDDETAVQA